MSKSQANVSEICLFKEKIIAEVIAHLEKILKVMETAAQVAAEAATHEESKAEDKYDTRGLEASYLAGGQARRAEEIRHQITFYKSLKVKALGKKPVVSPMALVELETDSKKSTLFLVATAGGMSVNVDNIALQIISPDSVLGGELMGKSEGESFETEIAKRLRNYKICSIR